MDKRTGARVNPRHIVSLEYTSWPAWESEKESIQRQGRFKHWLLGKKRIGHRVRLIANLSNGDWAVLESSLEQKDEVPVWMGRLRREIEYFIRRDEGAVMEREP